MEKLNTSNIDLIAGHHYSFAVIQALVFSLDKDKALGPLQLLVDISIAWPEIYHLSDLIRFTIY